MEDENWDHLWRTFGERLMSLRKQRGLGRRELAELLGVQYNTVQRWEREGRLPTLDSAAALAVALGISIDALCGLGHRE